MSSEIGDSQCSLSFFKACVCAGNFFCATFTRTHLYFELLYCIVLYLSMCMKYMLKAKKILE